MPVPRRRRDPGSKVWTDSDSEEMTGAACIGTGVTRVRVRSLYSLCEKAYADEQACLHCLAIDNDVRPLLCCLDSTYLIPTLPKQYCISSLASLDEEDRQEFYPQEVHLQSILVRTRAQLFWPSSTKRGRRAQSFGSSSGPRSSRGIGVRAWRGRPRMVVAVARIA